MSERHVRAVREAEAEAAQARADAKAHAKVIYERSLLRELNDARENGYDLACPVCGVGIYDESDEHIDNLHKLHKQVYPEQEVE